MPRHRAQEPAPDSASSMPSLRGYRLRLAWALWAGAVLMGLVFLVAFGGVRAAQMAGLASDNAAGLARLGLSPQFLANYLTALDCLLFAVFASVGVLIFLRRPDNWLSIVASVGLILQGAAMIRPEDTFGAAPPEWRLFAVILTCIVNTCSVTCLVLLPDGRFVPAYMKPMTVFWAACTSFSHSSPALTADRWREPRIRAAGAVGERSRRSVADVT